MRRVWIISEEVVLANYSGEVIFWMPLSWSRKWLELSESFGVVDTLFEQVEFRFTNSHLSFHFEHAFTCIVERIEADWLKGKILRVAPKKIQCFWFWLLGMSFIHRWGGSLLFKLDDFASAFIKVNVEEDHLLKVTSHLAHLCLPQCLACHKVALSWNQLHGLYPYDNEFGSWMSTYSFLKSLSVNVGKFAINKF